MDVQAASGAATAAPPLPPISFPGFADADPTVAAAQPASQATPNITSTPDPTKTASISSPSVAASEHPAMSESDGTLKPLVAKLYNAVEQNVEVSFQVAKGLNEVVTVFTDKSTGKVIVQFPSEQIIALAQFFQKLAGNVLDLKA